jgi:hypothetical protein
MTRDRGVRWLKWVSEFVLIVGSVYLGVYLEGASQRRSDRGAALVALSQLLGELQEDITDFDRIISKQDSLHVDYTNLRRWLADRRPYPADSLAGALYRVSAENSTLFPRRASWTTMVAGNQLADLQAPDLVLRLGQLYETIYDRIDYDGALYDRNLSAATQGSAAIRWQSLRSAPLFGDAAEVEHLAAALEFIHLTWNLWYRDLLIEFRSNVVEAIAMVEEYLAAN